MNIITLHEAEQRKALRLPLGTDQQGRYPEAAHVATDVGADDDGEGGSLFGPFSALPAVAIGLVGLAAFAALIFAGWQELASWLRIAFGARL